MAQAALALTQALRSARSAFHISLRALSCFASVVALTTLCTSTASAQQGAATLVGVVKDASTDKPVSDAVVTVTSPSLQAEEIAVTDASGSYRLVGLPPGLYVLRLEKESFRPYARKLSFSKRSTYSPSGKPTRR